MTTTTTRGPSCWPSGLTWSHRPSATRGRHLPNFHVFHPSSPNPSSHSYYDELSTARHDIVGRHCPVLVAASVQFSWPPLSSFPCPLTLWHAEESGSRRLDSWEGSLPIVLSTSWQASTCGGPGGRLWLH